jgi:hypothetical protein
MADFDPAASADALREELAPFVGERAVTLFAFAVADAYPAPSVAAGYRHEIEDSGDDPLDPQVTEAERLLIDWGRRLGAGPATADPALEARMAETFHAELRETLLAFAAALVARCVLARG